MSAASKSIWERAKTLNYQYELVFGMYVLERWEKVVVNIAIILIFIFLMRVIVSNASSLIAI